MRGARWVLAAVVMVLAFGGVAPASAQGIDAGTMPGMQEVVMRTFEGTEEPGAVTSVRDFARPQLALLVVGVYVFDTEANASNAFTSGEVNLNATGIDGQSLPLTDIQLPLGLEHIAATALEDRVTPAYNFVLATVLDGRYLYGVVQITTGAPPEADAAAIVRAMAGIESDPTAAVFSADGTSTGGVWSKLPSLGEIERRYRDVVSVEDAIVFPA